MATVISAFRLNSWSLTLQIDFVYQHSAFWLWCHVGGHHRNSVLTMQNDSGKKKMLTKVRSLMFSIQVEVSTIRNE